MSPGKPTAARAVPTWSGPQDQPPIYFETRVRRLPGFLWKRVAILPVETGLLVERGEIRRVLPLGRHRVGWGFLGLGTPGTVGRLRSDRFTLPLRFYRLGEDTKEPLDAFSQASVLVADPSTFYRFAVAGRSRLTPRQLGNAVSAGVQVMLDRLATFFEPALLQADPKVGERLTEQVAGPLGEQLRDRGLRLDSLHPLVFRPCRESEALLEEALSLQAEIAGTGAKDRAALRQKVERFVSRALEVELASPSEVEALRTAAGTSLEIGSTGGLLDTVGQMVQRLTGQAGERARRLPVAPAAKRNPALSSWMNWLEVSLTGLLLAGAVAALPVYWLWYRGQGFSWQAYLVGFGGFVGGVRLMLLAISEVEKRLKQRQAHEETGLPWFKKWLSSDAAAVDEVIREQVATEMESGALPELQSAAVLCQKAGKGQEAVPTGVGMLQLAEDLRLLALNIRGAPRAATAFPSRGREALTRGARLIAFEEETLRLSRIIVSHASRLKAQAQGGEALTEDTAQLSEALSALRRHFTKRSAVIAGIPDETPPADGPKEKTGEGGMP